jgi:NAD(P)-dependent dehydrogenase (short-subunit alcohol dehydrogenase family)
VAELLVDLGACVVVNGRDGTAVSEAVERMGGSATGFEGSPADPATADALIDCCVAEFGGIDILINCAGTAEPAGSSIKDVTGQIFIAAGVFVGRFDRATPGIVAYRDHHDSPPWSIDELAGLIVAR